ncbi:MAG: DNA adenine methylase [Candidatus Avoscillospira sp.]
MRAIAKPFIPWIGGKEKLAPYVRQVLPPNPKVYVEPFGGSGAILLGLPASKTRIDVYNDFSADLVNLFLCVRDRLLALLKELGHLPLHSRAEFECIKAVLRRDQDMTRYFSNLQTELEITETEFPPDQAEELREILQGQAELYNVKRAAAFFRLGRGSFNGTFSSFAIKPVDIRAFFKLIADANERLQNVVIENKDAVQLIQDMDGKGVTFYCDPPYYQAEQHYEVEFTKQDHIRLHDVLNHCSGNVIVSYNDCDYIRELYGDFYILAFSRPNSMSHKAGSQYREIIMTNFDPRAIIPQTNLFEAAGQYGDMELVYMPERPLKQS